jgi:hypothetical protein
VIAMESGEVASRNYWMVLCCQNCDWVVIIQHVLLEGSMPADY